MSSTLPVIRSVSVTSYENGRTIYIIRCKFPKNDFSTQTESPESIEDFNNHIEKAIRRFEGADEYLEKRS